MSDIAGRDQVFEIECPGRNCRTRIVMNPVAVFKNKKTVHCPNPDCSVYLRVTDKVNFTEVWDSNVPGYHQFREGFLDA